MEDDRRPWGPGEPSPSPFPPPGRHGGDEDGPGPEPGAYGPDAPAGPPAWAGPGDRAFGGAQPPGGQPPQAPAAPGSGGPQPAQWQPAAPSSPYSIPSPSPDSAAQPPRPQGPDPLAPAGGSGHPEPQPAAAPTGPAPGTGYSPGAGDGPPHVPAGAEGVPGPGDRPRRSRKGLVIGLISGLVVLALVGGGVSWYILTLPQPEDTADAYAKAWNSQDYAAMGELAAGGGAAAALKRLDENLGIDTVSVTTGQVEEGDDSATVPFDAAFGLSNAGEWSYSGELPLVQADGEWKVDFSPAALHPDLGPGQTLVRTNEWGERGHVLAADGTRLDDGSASGSVQMIVGEIGTVAEEDLADLGPAYEVGDPVGVSGVQKTYQDRLAGKAATAIRVAKSGTPPQDVPEDAPTLATLGGSDGKDVTLSLDPRIQAAVSQAIVDQSKPTAMVALRPSTGEVLAAANVPGGFNRALDGQYPAGSIFKIISYHALLNSGMGMDAQLNCPKKATVGGRPYKNAGDAAYGAQTVTEAFATSCNTALVQEVADRLDGASLLKSAERFGFNTGFAGGVPVFKPSLPQPDSVSLLTASSIGQGQVLTSPLHMATLPAAVADGSWRAPLLVTEPAPADRPEPRPIDHAQHLRDMTRAVVTQGTAKDVGFTGEVHGKSGTAEYGTAEEGEELPAHGWFVGYEGDIAFAVVVEDGQSGSGAAAPLAKAFLDAL
ncbi:penicillin-binding transpeptidase domain-containing protein [Streptomonospora sp. PA3]|uniref:penicillin-binding transpeptidase domain-containing protein n=1 Tax=Streptomonospora sp. PA3 TaxID=2607326 RepID=UPI0031BB3465